MDLRADILIFFGVVLAQAPVLYSERGLMPDAQNCILGVVCLCELNEWEVFVCAEVEPAIFVQRF